MWYFIRHGQVHLAIDEPHDRVAADECLAAIERIYPSVNQAMREDVEMTLLIASWFRSHADELQRTLSPDEAKERLRIMVCPLRPAFHQIGFRGSRRRSV